MNTKQLIKEINEGCVLAKIERKEIIELLQQGENDRIENILLRVLLYEITIKSGYFSKRDKEYIEEIKQKYFPKGEGNFCLSCGCKLDFIPTKDGGFCSTECEDSWNETGGIEINNLTKKETKEEK